jgi:iron(III) transport system ATP-binding protein
MLHVRDLCLDYKAKQGAVRAVNGVSLEVPKGQFYTLLGPSGCGKTSTLRCIAGLETPTEGSIEIGDVIVYSGRPRVLIPADRRDIGMVFQSYAIWPHMTVFENVAFPLRYGRKHLSAGAIADKAMWALELVDLSAFAERPAPLLSGGQQQRVALARALVREPSLLLLDEPLSNLDSQLRESMRQQIKQLARRLDITTLYVTHDQLEALTMSDVVALMDSGKIVQEGPPRTVYMEPANAFVANFLGRTNLVAGHASAGTPPSGVLTPWGFIACSLPDWAADGTPVTLGFRPECATLLEEDALGAALAGKVAAAAFAGSAVEYEIDVGGRLIHVTGGPASIHAVGDAVALHIPPGTCHILKQEG